MSRYGVSKPVFLRSLSEKWQSAFKRIWSKGRVASLFCLRVILRTNLPTGPTKCQTNRDCQIRISRLTPPCLAALCAPQSLHLRTQPDCHIPTLTKAFIIDSPVGDPIPLLLELVPTGIIEFIRYTRYPINQENRILTVMRGSVQQGRYMININPTFS